MNRRLAVKLKELLTHSMKAVETVEDIAMTKTNELTFEELINFQLKLDNSQSRCFNQLVRSLK